MLHGCALKVLACRAFELALAVVPLSVAMLVTLMSRPHLGPGRRAIGLCLGGAGLRLVHQPPVLGTKSIYARLAHNAVQYCSLQNGPWPSSADGQSVAIGAERLQLAIASEDIPAGVADAEAVRGQDGTAPNEIAPSHSLGVVAEPGGGGAAWSQSVQIDGCRGRGR
jgi:hypothetical protein